MTEPDLTMRTPVMLGVHLRAPAARRWAVDVAIAAAVTAAQIGGTYASTSWNPHHGTAGNATYVALAVGGASLIARRRYPVGVLAVALATALSGGVSGHAGDLARADRSLLQRGSARSGRPRSRPCSSAMPYPCGRPG